jgi:hypothetical protein
MECSPGRQLKILMRLGKLREIELQFLFVQNLSGKGPRDRKYGENFEALLFGLRSSYAVAFGVSLEAGVLCDLLKNDDRSSNGSSARARRLSLYSTHCYHWKLYIAHLQASTTSHGQRRRESHA